MKRGSVASAITKSALIATGLTCGLLLAVIVGDIHNDRAYHLTLTGPVTVYADPVIPDSIHSNQAVTMLGPQDSVEVRRIDRDAGWVRVRLSDGREGYIFLDAKIRLTRE
jgi:hypothetical protein